MDSPNMNHLFSTYTKFRKTNISYHLLRTGMFQCFCLFQWEKLFGTEAKYFKRAKNPEAEKALAKKLQVHLEHFWNQISVKYIVTLNQYKMCAWYCANSHKMVKYTKTIRRLSPANCLSVLAILWGSHWER